MEKYGQHYSVQKEDVLRLLTENFDPSASLRLCDLTFGAGGHTVAMARAFPNSEVYAFDQDPDAIKNGQKRLKEENLADRVHLIYDNFRNFSEQMKNQKLDACLLDAGVSSHQFDTPERGFSFRFDAPLDMRMNPESGGPAAADVVNKKSEEELTEIIKTYGEDRFAKAIAKNIVKERQTKSIETTKELENICFHSYPKKFRHGNIHPATRAFQALRIYVNDELGVLSDIVDQVIPSLNIGGLMLVISFHSLEDRIIKHSFKNWSEDDCPIQILTKKPILPLPQEIFENSRSRSAKLRVVKRVKDWPSKNKYKNKE